MVSLVPWWFDLKLTRYIGQPKVGWLAHKNMYSIYYWEDIISERWKKAIFIDFLKERQFKQKS